MATMLGLYKFLFLFTLVAMVTAKGDEENQVVFFWNNYYPYTGVQKTLVDYSKLKIETLTVFYLSIPYLVGPISLNEELNEDTQIHYTIIGGDLSDPIDQVLSACKFFGDPFNDVFRPMFENHSDIARMDPPCPVPPGTRTIDKVSNPYNLVAPSVLKEGTYLVDIQFLCGGLICGGFGGQIEVREF